MSESTPPRIRLKKVAPPDGWPRFGWDKETTRAYFVANPPQNGDPVILLSTHAGFYTYQLVRVVALTAQHRIITSRAGMSGGTSFHRSGINGFMPKGQTTLMPPVPTLMEHLSDDCDIQLDVGMYAPP